ncbi:chemotaxis protein CheW [Natronobacterium texcoconense]|uniref:CheW-like domain-containing protein n=1 Tax=Natronobacterium texcoconense TaxID=1095778 RepID=A0A1H1B4W4_NATTX|nr:chemotaxis protein CheW [Natronobacterium texcoconense]SDQ46964.1 CheW-like domain-containing protein [Natronobacterium texcoconense]
MAELPDKLLGIDIDEDRDRKGRDSSDSDPEDEEDHVRAVTFRVGDHRLAVPVDAVRTTTELHDELTDVPRTPAAIDGVVDLRGEITAVIDPAVHFPPATVDDDSRRLLVFDHPDDQQAAAIRVDEVLQVESVPESQVYDEESVEASEFSGDVLEHPLVDALLERERRPESRGTDPVGGLETSEGRPDESVRSIESADNEADFAAEPVDTAGHAESVSGVDDAVDSRIVVEGIPLIDVDNLLLASGTRASPAPVR